MRRTALTVLALMPWGSALYLLYRLEMAGVWAVDQPLRPLLSLLTIAAGLFSSLALHSYLTRRH